MSKRSEFARVVFFNIVGTLTLMALVIIAPPFVHSLGKLFGGDPDPRPNLPIYDGVEWANQHYREFRKLKSLYYDYYVWRRRDFSGETINVTDGVRKTTGFEGPSEGGEVWFFGGSTTWGTGVNDQNTYPSLFAKHAHRVTRNFGESGYISRQSLAYLTNLYIGEDGGKRTIVFYDGANDVAKRCRREVAGEETDLQGTIRDRLKGAQFSFRRTFAQLIEAARELRAELAGWWIDRTDHDAYVKGNYACSTEPKRAEAVARSLVQTWAAASALAKSKGDNFVAILQPVALMGKPRTDYLNFADMNSVAMRLQFDAVYPLVVTYARTADINFLDLTDLYDGCPDCYADFCHVGVQGHNLLVNRLLQVIP